jgi:hypothetical protein
MEPDPTHVRDGRFLSLKYQQINIQMNSVTGTDPFEMDLDPLFHFDTDLDLTFLYGSGSLLFQRGNVPKTILFIHIYLIFLVSWSTKTQPAGIFF